MVHCDRLSQQALVGPAGTARQALTAAPCQAIFAVDVLDNVRSKEGESWLGVIQPLTNSAGLSLFGLLQPFVKTGLGRRLLRCSWP